ncbi:uncharacterized protein SPAR_O01240 [Saccharomyces paradoxus]|uniref:Uncharacterized protein n=1 Tax=Saccharomyces paradoxus TaxID=27291 RepID=A0A8B8UZI1_SACPA|nr:uncharacterized protein SPAR_O01240 [Saccharomyces paradoxus]QHS76096.1 hypothetical protein SPAR_O01240 [Saccharomyces paradoxus]
MSKLSPCPHAADFINLEEPPEPKEFFQDLCAVPNSPRRRFENSRRSTHYCEALSYSRQKLPALLSKMTLQELRHNMSTFSLQEKDQMNDYDTYKVIDMGDRLLLETLSPQPRDLFEKLHTSEANLIAETVLDESTAVKTELRPSSSARNSSVFLYEDYKKFIYQQLDMFS